MEKYRRSRVIEKKSERRRQKEREAERRKQAAGRKGADKRRERERDSDAYADRGGAFKEKYFLPKAKTRPFYSRRSWEISLVTRENGGTRFEIAPRWQKLSLSLSLSLSLFFEFNDSVTTRWDTHSLGLRNVKKCRHRLSQSEDGGRRREREREREGGEGGDEREKGKRRKAECGRGSDR